jgi:hypothetical protein
MWRGEVPAGWTPANVTRSIEAGQGACKQNGSRPADGA